MTTTERHRFTTQGICVGVVSALWIGAIILFVGTGKVMAEASWADAITEGAKAGAHVVDQASQKDVLWLALAACILSSLATIVTVALTFWIAITGVKAMDRIGNHLNFNPWDRKHK